MSSQSQSEPVRTVLFSSLYPNSVLPRAGVFVETRLRELINTGRVVAKVVAPVRWSPVHDPKFGVYAQMAAAPIPKVGMWVAPFLMALGAATAFRQLRDEGFDFEVIDAHYYYPDGVAAALLAQWFKRPFTVTARGSDINLISRFTWSRWLMTRSANRAKASIGVSSALVQKMKQIGFDERKLHTMRNGVDLQLFQPPMHRRAVRGQLGLDGHPVILTVGNLNEHKGQALVIRSLPHILAQFPKARLVVLGDGPDAPTLRALVDSLFLTDCVTFVSTMSQAKLCQWYGAADVLVLASTREGWPNVLLEAMACGTPVVAADVGGVREIVHDSSAGRIVHDRDEISFSESICQILAAQTDPNNVRKYAQQFSWESTSLAQAHLFEQITGRIKLEADNIDLGRQPLREQP